MGCTDCFNGCNSVTPDKCVKYTGPDVPELTITKGDTLYSVDNTIIMKILNIIIGEGISPDISPEILCTDIINNLPGVEPYDLNDYLTSLITVVCKHSTDITTLTAKLNTINAAYTMSCVTGVAAGADQSDTHKVLQAVITNFCTLKTAYDAFVLEVPTLYVKKADINGYIDSYITAHAPGNLVSSKMIPYVVVEYYGSISNFDASGAGLDKTSTGGQNWTKVFLCNGANGTPDKRGVVAVGITTVPGGGAFNPKVDPAIVGNPTYTLGATITGSNTVILTTAQMPAHTHTATVTATQPAHSHLSVYNIGTPSVGLTNATSILSTALYGNENSYSLAGAAAVANSGLTSLATPTITASAVINPEGTGNAHSNVQPVLPCYYIIHIP